MHSLTVAQFMAAAVFFTVALMHVLVWWRKHPAVTHFCFALACAAAGANAIAESHMYRAADVPAMATALKWYVATSGFWILALIWFIVAYAQVGKFGRGMAISVSVVFLLALLINVFSPYSYLYTQIDGLREIALPWGGQIHLAEGRDSPWRLVGELVMIGLFILVIDGCRSLWRHGQRVRAYLFGLSVATFLIFFGTHAFLVDTGRLDAPYLSTYGFLLVVLVMSYDLAGEVVRASELSAQLERKEAALRTAVADERTRIASDLHDSVTQTLFSTAAIADALPEVWNRYPEKAREGLQELRQLTRGALAEMRSLLVELHPASLSENSLGDLLRQLADALAGRCNIHAHVDVACECDLPDDVQIAMYRIAQEALNNVVKHAHAGHVTLRLRCTPTSVVMTVSDDGRGFDPANGRPGHLGLEIMRQRVRTIGGSIDIEADSEQGTTVTVRWGNASSGGSDDGA